VRFNGRKALHSLPSAIASAIVKQGSLKLSTFSVNGSLKYCAKNLIAVNICMNYVIIYLVIYLVRLHQVKHLIQPEGYAD